MCCVYCICMYVYVPAERRRGRLRSCLGAEDYTPEIATQIRYVGKCH